MTEDRSKQRALELGALSFAYQPIVAASTRVPAYWECLLRLGGSATRPIGATGFIEAAEHMGDMPALDRRVLDMALDALERHAAAALSVNLSGLTVADRGWLSALNRRLGAAPALGPRLVVEITETAALGDIPAAARFVSELRALDVRVALDDFGAGHTSFRNLMALKVDIVKIDAGYAAGIAEAPRQQSFVCSLADAARDQGLSVVAEGAMSDADEKFLVGEGVEFFQGSRYGKPVSTPPWEK